MVSKYWEAGGKNGRLREIEKIYFGVGKSGGLKERINVCWSALQRNFDLCIPRKELRGLSPNFHIHWPESYLYIPTIGPPIFLQQNMQTDRGNI